MGGGVYIHIPQNCLRMTHVSQEYWDTQTLGGEGVGAYYSISTCMYTYSLIPGWSWDRPCILGILEYLGGSQYCRIIGLMPALVLVLG